MTSTIADDPVQLLKTLIACPSVTPEAAGVLDALEEALSSIGFAVTRLRFEGVASAAPEREAALANLLNIIGRRSGARSIITIG